MSTFSVPVVRIADEPIDHPNADRLSIMKIFGFPVISGKVDGEHRYKKGDHVVYVPEAGLVPEYLLRQGFWDEDKKKGILAGSNGNRVKPIKLRSIFSNGIMFPLEQKMGGWVLENGAGERRLFEDGDDAAEFLGIEKYEPPIPIGMSGEVANLFGVPHKYDFENLERVPDMFEDGEEVEATEKIHGCADYDTEIDTFEYGTMKIGEIVEKELVGTHVLCRDLAAGEDVYCKINGVSSQDNNDDWYEVEVENGKPVKLTGNHPVYIPSLQCYRRVDDLKGGEDVLLSE